MNRIKELRDKAHKNQKELALLLHVNRTTLTKWETGKHNPDVDTVKFLANYFNVSTDYLLGVSDDPLPHGKPAQIPTIEEMILNDPDLSQESKLSLLRNMQALKAYDRLKSENEEIAQELGVDANPNLNPKYN